MTRASTRRVLLCDCERTNPIDTATLGKALGTDLPECATSLCRRELGRATGELESGRPVLIGCTQEAPLFLEVAQPTGADVRFVNVREKAGWAARGRAAGPKMAALLAEAMLDVGGPGTVTLTSEGRTLVLGNDEAALEAAHRLAPRLDVTVLLDPAAGLTPPRVARLPIFRGSVRAARGHLGGFALDVEGLELLSPAARETMSFTPAPGNSLECDLVLDLRRSAPLFPAPDKRDGYLNPDPRDPGAVADALFELVDLVGEFDKPRYVATNPGICAHARSGIVGCSRCIDGCPTGAITAAGNAIEVDPFVCAGCGTCASVCPTGAVRYALPEAHALVTRMRTVLETYREAGGRDACLLVHDTEHGEAIIDALARHYDGLAPNVIPFAVNAPDQVGLEALLAARAFGAATVGVLAPPAGSAGPTGLTAAIELANFVLTSLGYEDGRIDLLVEADPEVVAARLEAWSQRGSRGPIPRGFAPGGTKRELLGLALAALHESAPAPVDEVALPAGAPFGTIEVDVGSCTLCLACVGACPANALRDDPDHPRVSFVESACVQCGLCARTCPERAITLRPRLDFTGEARRARVLKEEEPWRCVRCGQAFGTRSSIEKIVERMTGHGMFADESALNRLRMCADCRVIDLTESAPDPFAGGERPRPRTTEDYLRARELGREDDEDLA